MIRNSKYSFKKLWSFFYPKHLGSVSGIILAIWITTALIVLITVSYFSSLWLFHTPGFDEMENPKYSLSSFIYDDHDSIIGKYYVENREQVEYDSINPWLVQMLVLVEDERFFQHSGIDYEALWRVAVKTLILGEKQSGGGSTISQQLAKLLYQRPKIGNLGSLKDKALLVHIKFKEWLTAIKLEHNYTKEEIIALYLNKFEFVNGAHGIQAAAKIYFNKSQSELLPEESALLIGMLQNPSFYNPAKFAARAKRRRDLVLSKADQQLAQQGFKSDSLQLLVPDLSSFRQSSPVEGPAPYFRSEVTKIITQLLDDNQITREDGSPYNVYLDGLKIYTTIDLQYQDLAEKAMTDHMKWLQDRYWKNWKNKNPLTYQSKDGEDRARKLAFDRHLKASDRYLDLWHEDMTLLQSIDAEVPESLLAEALSSGSKSSLNAILDSTAFWDQVLLQYQKHLQLADSVFSSPVEALVFDYELSKKTQRMSPKDSVMYHLQHLQAGLLAVDPKTGYVKAWVGGINYDYFKFDHVTASRQVGSTVKPFVYAAAMQYKGIKPCQYFIDMPYTISPGEGNFHISTEWKPDNSTENFTYNPYNLYHGLLYSKNSITVRLMKELGDAQILRKLLKDAGVEVDKPVFKGLAVPDLPAICLGAMDVSLFEMVGAYTTFVNKGIYSKPQIIKRIEDRNGKVIYHGFSPKRIAVEPLTASVVSDMLQNNCKRNFSFNFKSKAGGKTGTTNDFVDGWFIGFTPNLVVGVWTGGDERFIRFTNLADGQGFVTARPMFEKFIQNLEKNVASYDTKASFPKAHPGMDQLTRCSQFKVIYPAEERKLRKLAEDSPELRDSIMQILQVN